MRCAWPHCSLQGLAANDVWSDWDALVQKAKTGFAALVAVYLWQLPPLHHITLQLNGVGEELQHKLVTNRENPDTPWLDQTEAVVCPGDLPAGVRFVGLHPPQLAARVDEAEQASELIKADKTEKRKAQAAERKRLAQQAEAKKPPPKGAKAAKAPKEGAAPKEKKEPKPKEGMAALVRLVERAGRPDEAECCKGCVTHRLTAYMTACTPLRCSKECCTDKTLGFMLQDKFPAPSVAETLRQYRGIGPFCPSCKAKYFGEAAMKKRTLYTGALGLNK